MTPVLKSPNVWALLVFLGFTFTLPSFFWVFLVSSFVFAVPRHRVITDGDNNTLLCLHPPQGRCCLSGVPATFFHRHEENLFPFVKVMKAFPRGRRAERSPFQINTLFECFKQVLEIIKVFIHHQPSRIKFIINK